MALYIAAALPILAIAVYLAVGQPGLPGRPYAARLQSPVDVANVSDLIAKVEAHLREAGVGTASLACAVGNDRAARFYEKRGWLRTGTVTDDVVVPGGTFPLEVWRYEKSLR